MNQVRLGATDVFVPELGIGAWSWGDTLFWSYGKTHNDRDVRAAIETALARGIHFFDTAEVYGNGHSERHLGEYIREKNASLIIATKFMPFPWRLRYTNVIQALQRSLQRLNVPRVDLYQVHQPLPPIAPETWMKGMAEAVNAGLTRAVGVSNYNAAWTRRAHRALAERDIPLASNQLKYSLLDRRIERNGTLQTCRELNVTIIAYSPLEMGLLSGKYSPTNVPPGLRNRRYSREYLAKIQPHIGLLREMGGA
ncbi:MAG: aldo/keto reductase, partial [Anaerolineae bacterium]|nr:aldo/keto reductase [Anaerolineae bacterium]